MLEEKLIASAVLNSTANRIDAYYGNSDSFGYPVGGTVEYVDGLGNPQTYTSFTHHNTGDNSRWFYQVREGNAGVAFAPFDVWRTPTSGGQVRNYMVGGSGDDVFWDNASGGSLIGLGGNDILISTGGNSYLEGGDGNDLLVVGMEPTQAEGISQGGANFLAAWKQKLLGFNSNMTESEMQSFFRYHGDYYPINKDGSEMRGGEGDDTLISRGGSDTLFGGAGQDVLLGGAGHDSMYGDSNYTGDTPPSIGNNNDIMSGGSGSDWIYGEAGDDLMHGDEDDDMLNGGIGNDTLLGGAGNDDLFGGDGSDMLLGGIGADDLFGGAGFDFASYEHATSGVIVSLAEKGYNTGEALGDTFDSIEGLIGSAYSDQLEGDINNNYLDGGAGNDSLAGGAGADSIFGGTGNDIIIGGADYDNLVGGEGNDTYIFNPGSGYDHIFENANGGIDNLFLNNITQIGVYRQGNHLLFAVNNDDVIALDNWFINQAAEYIDFEAYQMRYLVSDFASQAITLQSNQILALGRENSVENIKSTFIPTEGQEFQTTDVTLLGVAPVETFESVAA